MSGYKKSYKERDQGTKARVKSNKRRPISQGDQYRNDRGGISGDDNKESHPQSNTWDHLDKQGRLSPASDDSSPPGSDDESDDNQSREEEKQMLGHGDTNVDKRSRKDELAEQLREEMSHIPLCELREMQEKMGLKAFSRMQRGLQRGSSSKSKTFKRANKNRPTEMSARKPVSKQISVPKEKTKKIRDPRFDDLSGEFDDKIFRKKYGFIKDVKAKEKIEVERMMVTEKDAEKKSEMKYLLSRMEEQEVSERRKIRREEIERDLKKKELEQIKKGKKPYFVHKGAVNAIEQKEFKEELEKSGKMAKVLKRKEKKMEMKEKKRKKWSTDAM